MINARYTNPRLLRQCAYGKPLIATYGKEVLINAPITHKNIANSTNMNRETASRALGQLFDEGLVKQVDHLFTVHKVDKLEKASG